ncbi:MAG: tRNA preQ1(34) S-adenosylmethionine ribosyltransferase-isomerase QueA [Planctomycetota bacterium]
MQTTIFDFHLPPQLIAQAPLPDREASRLLILNRADRTWRDAHIRELPGLLRPGDLLILNDTRVIPARLRATRDSSGGKIEILLLPPETNGLGDASSSFSRNPKALQTGGRGDGEKRIETTICRTLIHSRGHLKPNETFTLAAGPKATLRERLGEAGDIIEFHCSASEFEDYVKTRGEVPLPPYIHRLPGPSSDNDKQRYQTIFAHTPGAVAAPTAGLHFSDTLFAALKARGVEWKYITLHVGPGTFRPVKADRVEEHFVDPEPYSITPDTAQAVAAAKREGRRVIAVGTTSLRTLEGSAANGEPAAASKAGNTNLFVYPPYRFRVVDALLTNFHVPKSSLLMLVCAFAAPETTDGIAFVKHAYAHAVANDYRFYSYGDACLFL